MIKDYEMVIGLEVHAELKTETKIFCGCSTHFGAPPNTQCCPVCMGMPGTLPVLNKKVVDYAIKAGLATNCTIAHITKQDRKNYFYPDLPKAYQISQYDLPLCEGGYIDIETPEGEKRIGITRIHIEEDAGKLVHDEKLGTLIDCNRCGVPLIEIVSEPDINSSAEARAYLEKLRAIILYTGISDCKMNEGSLRCDVNLSVRKKGESSLGVRTEMKNLNSFAFITKAIEYEYKRQAEALERGETLIQETRRFDAETGKTYSMRKKENADDYRYFPDPDLPPMENGQEYIDALRGELPVLPDVRKAEYIRKYELNSYDAERITNDIALADYFEKAVKLTEYSKQLANMLVSDAPQTERRVSPQHLAALCDLYGEGRINSSTAKKLLREIWETDGEPEKIVSERGLEQINDWIKLEAIAREIISQDEKSAADYKRGKLAAAKAIIGKVMSATGGRGNPDRARALELVRPAVSLDAAVAQLREHAGAPPRLVASSAVWPVHKRAPVPLTPGRVRDWCREGPVLLCLGTAQGLAPEVLERCDGQLRPLRFLGYNHLSVRSAAAILADRILGDYC